MEITAKELQENVKKKNSKTKKSNDKQDHAR